MNKQHPTVISKFDFCIKWLSGSATSLKENTVEVTLKCNLEIQFCQWRVRISICWLVTGIHGIMKLRALATLWLSNPQNRHPVCTAPLPWKLWLNRQRPAVPARSCPYSLISLRGLDTYSTNPNSHSKTYINIFNQAALCSLAFEIKFTYRYV